MFDVDGQLLVVLNLLDDYYCFEWDGMFVVCLLVPLQKWNIYFPCRRTYNFRLTIVVYYRYIIDLSLIFFYKSLLWLELLFGVLRDLSWVKLGLRIKLLILEVENWGWDLLWCIVRFVQDFVTSDFSVHISQMASLRWFHE